MDQTPQIPQTPEEPVRKPAVRTPGLRDRIYGVPVLGTVAHVVAPPRTGTPSAARRVISWTSGVIAVLGVAMVFYPIAGQHYPGLLRIPVEKAIEWSNFFSDMQSNKLQSRLKGNLADGGLADRYRSRTLAEGDPLTRIQIPKIGLDSVVVEGISLSALKAGAGHYPQTPLPGEVGNVGIAGHRTTYGRPFNRMDELRTGDTIILTTPVGRFTYSVARDPFIVAPTDLSVLDKTSDGELTLTSCHPKGSARQRIIVRAKLVRSEPVKASPAKKVA